MFVDQFHPQHGNILPRQEKPENQRDENQENPQNLVMLAISACC